MVKPVIDSLDQVAEDLRPHYTKSGDRFVLDLDGAPDGFVRQATHAEQVNKVAEFRDNNTEMKTTLEALQAKVESLNGIDPEAARAALAQVAELQKKGVRKASDVDAAVGQALDAFKSTELEPLRKLLVDEQSARKAADEKVRDAAIRHQVIQTFRAAGGQDAATDFIVARARAAFEMEGDRMAAKAGLYSTENPGEPLALDEWMTAQTREIGFAFGSSNGGGASTKDAPGALAPLPSGSQYLRNPTPEQLGEHGQAIREGTMVIVND